MGFKDSDKKGTIGGKIKFEILCQCLDKISNFKA